MSLTKPITTIEQIDGKWTLIHQPPRAVVVSTDLLNNLIDIVNSKVDENVEAEIRKDERDKIIERVKSIQSGILADIKYDYSPTGKVAEVVAASFIVLLNDLQGKRRGRQWYV